MISYHYDMSGIVPQISFCGETSGWHSEMSTHYTNTKVGIDGKTWSQLKQRYSCGFWNASLAVFKVHFCCLTQSCGFVQCLCPNWRNKSICILGWVPFKPEFFVCQIRCLLPSGFQHLTKWNFCWCLSFGSIRALTTTLSCSFFPSGANMMASFWHSSMQLIQLSCKCKLPYHIAFMWKCRLVC